MVYVITILLLVLSALFSGLNLGLMSLSPQELKRKAALGDARAARIYPVRRRGNLLLVTLLLGNIAVISILSIFLDSFLSGVVAAILSTLLVTVFGEILPQAFFSRFALELGSRLTWLVTLFLWLLYPVSWPLAWVLDRILGDEMPSLYSKMELVKILEEHRVSPHSEIAADEERIARGALTFGDKRIREVMTPRSQIVGARSDEILDRRRIEELDRSGHSRFVIWGEEPERVAGMLYLHDLVRPETRGRLAGDVAEAVVYSIDEEDSLDVALRGFIESRHHLFIVTNQFSEVVGVVSMEDILEEILERQVMGEFDRHEDLRVVARGKRAKPTSGPTRKAASRKRTKR